jgi:hypothetical protein
MPKIIKINYDNTEAGIRVTLTERQDGQFAVVLRDLEDPSIMMTHIKIFPILKDAKIYALRVAQQNGKLKDVVISEYSISTSQIIARLEYFIAKIKKYPLEKENNWHDRVNYRSLGGKLVHMHPDDYLKQVRPLDIDESSRENIDNIKDHIKKKGKLDPLHIYHNGKEDGRHRAHAAKELGIKAVPVIDFRSTNKKILARLEYFIARVSAKHHKEAKEYKEPKEISIKKSETRAFHGKQIPTKAKLSKLETGVIGEGIVKAYMKHHLGHQDSHHLNLKDNNFPVDLMGDHMLVEVKSGLVSNQSGAHHWRATLGMPGKEESKWLSTASSEEKSAWNKTKSQEVINRKHKVLEDVTKELGVKVHPKTITTIINPDTKTADLYHFDNFHHRISWKGDHADKGFIGSFSYE